MDFIAAIARAGLFAASIALFTAVVPTEARAEPEDKTEAPFFFVHDRSSADALPLKESRANIAVAGVIARVRVTQLYENTGSTPLEAEYVFPASTRAAVYGMQMRIGARTIEAQIEPRAKARDLYDRARNDGRTASLLELHRDNVFAMNVANILPGDRIEVLLDYTELLVPEDGVYELVFPTVVGPRYTGRGGDEEWAHNPYLSEGSKPTLKWTLSAQVNAGMPIRDVTSPSHRIVPRFEGTNALKIDTDDEHGADRDFILRYRLGGAEIETGLLLFNGNKDSNYFLMMMQPPKEVSATSIPPREYIFVVDVSGSMSGFPIETARDLIRKLLGGLRSEDVFNLILFSGGSTVMSEKSVEATPDNIDRALQIVDSMHGAGGTELLPALKRALRLPRSLRHSTTIAVITDGYVAVEKATYRLIRQSLGRANLFAFGIGTSVNRALIEGMARAGRGQPFVVRSASEAHVQADKFLKYVSTPALSGISASFEGFDAYDVEPDPKAMGDLFASRPIVVFGKYRGAPSGRIVVHGSNALGPIDRQMRVSDYTPSDDNTALRYLWARHRIARLADEAALDPSASDNEAKAAIRALGLAYGLLTAETSFVAIDSSVRNTDGKPTTVRQPLPLPEGVLGDAFASASGGGLGLAYPMSSSPAMGSVIMGSLDTSVIRRVFQAAHRTVRACYEKRLQKRPGIAGRLVVELTIGPDGRVISTNIGANTLKDADIEGCVLKALKSLRFPTVPGGGEVKISYPFVFST